MLHPTLLLLLLVSFAAPTPAQADSILYVKPTEGTKCPSEPCHTLDWYVNETNHYKYFPYNNTVMKFLPGTHNLSERFNFHHLTDLTLEATSPTMNETVIFCSNDCRQALLFDHASQISIEGLSIVSFGSHTGSTLHFQYCAYIRLSRVTIEVVGYANSGIWFTEGHSINVSLVSIHLLEGESIGITLWRIDIGNCILEEVEVISLDSHNMAIKIVVLCELHDQSQYIIRRCSFELQVVIQASVGNCQSTNLVILENVIFKNIGGRALHLAGNISVLLQNVTFANNSNSGTSVAGAAVVDIYYVKNVSFIDCEFYNNLGTPISADQGSYLQFSGTIVFRNNTGYDGGAMSFTVGSYVAVSKNTNVIFENNTAENAGGAVFVNQDNTYCFFRQTHGDPFNCLHHLPFNLSFINNTALKGGDAIYGAGISDHCIYLGKFYGVFCHAQELLQSANSGLYFEPDLDSDPSQISSDPTRVCLCENGTLSCSITSWSETRYPGEEFTISAIDVGDINGPVDGPVYAQFLPQYNGVLGGLQYSQVTRTKCKELKYSVLSKPGVVVMALTVNTARILRYQDHSSTVYINITLLPCPLGFKLSPYPHQCICDTQLMVNNIQCNITTQTIQRSGTVWVNASFSGNISNGVIVHKNCPFGYCNTEEVHVNLKQPDTQCAFNHSGTLCGACQPGLSLALGSPQCLRHCSNSYLALLLAFAVAGLALVLFIKVLNLTVAQGTINGLIFYANVIWANQTTFFPAGDTTPLTVFIAWLNLDFGIQICFFNGLDAYWKTWLQFNFTWVIVALIVILSRYSAIAAKLIGNNSVPVIATLLLLSYAKIQRAVITAITVTYLELPDGSKVAVWSFDGNILYLGPKHLPLFVFAILVMLFIWLPYTMTLLFAQCIQRIEHHRIRRWMLRLKPFFDAYAAPFNDKHRYWVGALLLARGILLPIVAIDVRPNDSLLAVVTVALVLLMYTANLPHVYPGSIADKVGRREYWVGSVYRNWYLSLLESSFIFNLAVLAAATFYVNTQGGDQAAVIYISVGTALCQFIGIVIFHASVELKKCWQKHQDRQMLHQQPPVNREEYEPLDQEATVQKQRNWPPVVRYNRMSQLRESLLEYEDM